MNVDRKTYVLGAYRNHPIVEIMSVPVHERVIETAFLDRIFGKKAKGLKTWPKAGDLPHWLACRNGIKLHTDPKFSRYAYQMVIRNDGWAMGGFDPEIVTILQPGACYILDTHSPHELVKTLDCRGRYFVGVGFDSNELLSLSEAATRLIAYCGAT